VLDVTDPADSTDHGFRDALLDVYLENPSRTLSTAFWKFGSRLDEFRTVVETDDVRVTRLSAWNEDELQVHWTRDRDRFPFSPAFVAESNLAVVHDDYLRHLPERMVGTAEPFFRMERRRRPHSSPNLPSGYRFQDVDVERETDELSELISRCYDDLGPDSETVAQWTEHPVFEEDLWVWIVERETGDYVGAGVAELDAGIREASLEWIQVLPRYHGEGLGRALVRELLRRVGGRVAFTTVSGRYDGDKGLKAFYERCGFQGDDIWWVFRD